MPPAESQPDDEKSQDEQDNQALVGCERETGLDAGADFFETRHKIFVVDLFTAETQSTQR